MEIPGKIFKQKCRRGNTRNSINYEQRTHLNAISHPIANTYQEQNAQRSYDLHHPVLTHLHMSQQQRTHGRSEQQGRTAQGIPDQCPRGNYAEIIRIKINQSTDGPDYRQTHQSLDLQCGRNNIVDRYLFGIMKINTGLSQSQGKECDQYRLCRDKYLKMSGLLRP